MTPGSSTPAGRSGPRPATGPGAAPARGYEVRWQLVIPVKDGAAGKSRLRPAPPLTRSSLAHAVALDTIESACRALSPAQVTVVTSDRTIAHRVRALGARVMADPGTGLNAAVAAGWGRSPDGPARRDGAPVASAGSEGGTRVRPGWAALLGDLPAMRPGDLAQALVACARQRAAVVPDAGGTGTVLLTSTVAAPRPQFGPGSAARHARTATVLALELPRLRRDVDTAAELQEAIALGVGPHTRLALGGGAAP